MIERVRGGRLSRRGFIARLGAVGVGMPMASVLLADAGLAQTTPPAYKPARRGGGGPLKLLFWQGPTMLNPHFATDPATAAVTAGTYKDVKLEKIDSNSYTVRVVFDQPTPFWPRTYAASQLIPKHVFAMRDSGCRPVAVSQPCKSMSRKLPSQIGQTLASPLRWAGHQVMAIRRPTDSTAGLARACSHRCRGSRP